MTAEIADAARRQEEEKDIEVIIILPSILLRYGTKNIEGKEHIVHIKKFV